MSMAQPWTERGLCRDEPIHIWHPSERSGSGDMYAQARAICNRCPVSADCLAYALSINETTGMWGGWSPEERRTGRLNPSPTRRRGRPAGKFRLLTPEEEIEAVRAIDNGAAIGATARKYGVSRSTIGRVVDRVRAVQVSTPVRPSHPQEAQRRIGATEETAPGAALTAAEGLEPDLSRRSNP